MHKLFNQRSLLNQEYRALRGNACVKLNGEQTMKLATLKNKRVAKIENGQLIPFDFPGGMLGIIQAGQAGLDAANLANEPVQPFDFNLLDAPILPSKIIAIGKNYAEHAKETNSDIPTSPIVFTKFTNSIIGYGGVVTWRSSLTKQVDYEAELAVVIGRTARHISQSEALDYIFGYTCANDVSARDLQASDKQWVRAKSLDTFCPLGPYLVTADEIPNPQDVNVRCFINGEMVQSGNSRDMIFNIDYLISFLSESFTLLPGDIILTGTPDGVGKFRNPPLFMQDGYEMVVEIDNVGRLVNRCRVE
jgi:2-keto-4-pentenoate hydratase/2-oxohepta-3-ene-1,7-dioic acid hydratase in catechol pathway